PSTEQFENCLFEELMNFTAPQRIWVEDESLNIGRIFLPVPFYDLMKSSSLVLVEMDMKYRLDRLNRDYGQESLILLEETILKIQKRLGIENAHKAVSALHRGDIREAASIVLGYYDKSYEYDRIQKNRNLLCRIFSDDGDPVAIAAAILDQMDKL
ncbi:hypothetical protein, partial [Oceanispirochaeta sp.]|uniref:hypothetical protein n=1 Tax=Oceanispirochaeta sp. TaxID=2035350 RepID=UPI00260EB40D